eukprot:4083168-Karenia_brevis.AAC.1
MAGDSTQSGCILRSGTLQNGHIAKTGVLEAGEGKEKEPCGHVLDEKMVHPTICKQGVSRMRPHRALAASACALLRKAGAEVDTERVVPELLSGDPGVRRATAGEEETPAVDAKLDLVASFLAGPKQYWLDVTIRSPHAARYDNAHLHPGVAAEAAVKSKRDRYGPQ